MKMNLFNTLIFIQLSQACAELIFTRLMKHQSLELSCFLQQNLGSLTGLRLYHRGAQNQITLLSVCEGGEIRVSPEHSGRLQLRGGLHSSQVNVTISHLEHGDTGLYMWELSHREDDNTDTELILSARKVFLLVEGAGRPCQCSSNYAALLLSIFAAVGLVVLLLSWLATEKCLKLRHHHTSQSPAPIYEEMTRKQQSTAIPQNNHKAPSHLEEDNFPVYANPNILHPQENYYACPRQLTLRA